MMLEIKDGIGWKSNPDRPGWVTSCTDSDYVTEIMRLRMVENAAKELVRVSDLISSTAKDRRIALINLRALV